MIITDITQIDNMAEQMFDHIPNFIAIDMNDYNRVHHILLQQVLKCHAPLRLA